MSLTETSLWEVVKKQLRFKLKSYRGMYTSMMVLQLLAILFSFGGEGSSGGSSGNLSYDLRYFTGNMILAFTMLWAFISAILITTQAYRFDDYTFVANRISSHLSNILFLGVASLLGGITVLLASQSMKLIVLFLQNREYIASPPLTLPQFVLGMAAMVMYIFLFTMLGYLAGMLVQKSKVFVVILPAVFFGALFIDGMLAEQPTLLVSIGKFFGWETSFSLFTLKILTVSALAFAAAVLMSNRMEVRR